MPEEKRYRVKSEWLVETERLHKGKFKTSDGKGESKTKSDIIKILALEI